MLHKVKICKNKKNAESCGSVGKSWSSEKDQQEHNGKHQETHHKAHSLNHNEKNNGPGIFTRQRRLIAHAPYAEFKGRFSQNDEARSGKVRNSFVLFHIQRLLCHQSMVHWPQDRCTHLQEYVPSHPSNNYNASLVSLISIVSIKDGVSFWIHVLNAKLRHQEANKKTRGFGYDPQVQDLNIRY